MWELTIANGAKLCGLEHHIIRMMYGVRLVDRVLTDVPHDGVGFVVKIEDMMIESHLQWYGHAMHGDINSQIREVMEVEMTEKRKKGQPRNRGKSA